MRQLLLATVLIIVPVGVFAVAELAMPSSLAAAATSGADATSLGDMTPFQTIATDLAGLAGAGDLAGAKTRIKDLETAWDDQEATLRPNNPTAWGNLDSGIDDALTAVRAATPDQAGVVASLTALQALLADPTAGAAPAGPVTQVSGVDVTDANGHALPCETMHQQLVAATIPAAAQAQVADLMAKGLERCNADDDTRADAFFAQGLALAAN